MNIVEWLKRNPGRLIDFLRRSKQQVHVEKRGEEPLTFSQTDGEPILSLDRDGWRLRFLTSYNDVDDYLIGHCSRSAAIGAAEEFIR